MMDSVDGCEVRVYDLIYRKIYFKRSTDRSVFLAFSEKDSHKSITVVGGDIPAISFHYLRRAVQECLVVLRCQGIG